VNERKDGPDRRIRELALGFAVVFLILVGRLVQLQLVEHERWAEMSRSYRMREETVPARRGWIVDRHGEVLVRNEEVHDLCADPRHLADPAVALAGFSRRLGRPAAEVRREYSRQQILRGHRTHVATVVEALVEDDGQAVDLIRGLGESGDIIVLARGLDLRERDGIEAGLEAGGVRGVYFRSRDRRFRPWAAEGALARVLGEVDDGGQGRGGIEEAMDPVLRGRDGRRRIERDSLGRELAVYRSEEEPAEDGRTVELLIDARIQDAVELVLAEAQTRLGAAKLVAVVEDVRDGDILALADRPGGNLAVGETFDPGALVGMFLESLQAYGFGEKTGVPLPGEVAGMIGEGPGGVAVTALQLVHAASAWANGGELLQVRLVKEQPRQVRRRVPPSGSWTEGGVRGGAAWLGEDGERWVASGVKAFPEGDLRWCAAVVVWEPQVGPEFRSGELVAGPILEEIARRVVASLAIRTEGSGSENEPCD